MEPEHTPLEKEKHLQITNFGVPCQFSEVYIPRGVAAFFSSKSAGVSIYLFFLREGVGGHVQRMNYIAS